MVANVTVCGTTDVAGGEFEFECVATIVDRITDVCICVTASVTVLVAGDAVVVLPPSTATTEYDWGSLLIMSSGDLMTGHADVRLDKRLRKTRE